MKNDGQTTENNRDSGVLSNPLSFFHGGYVYWYGGGLYGHDGSGRYWSRRSGSATYSSSLVFGDTYLNPQYNDNRGNGFAVRCVNSSKNPLSGTF